MRKIIQPRFLSVLLLCFASLANAQQVFKTTKTSVIGFLEYVPQDYHANSNKYPIMIFLHGQGERGSSSTDPAVIATTIQSVAKLGPPMYVKNGTQFPFILISPQLKNSYSTWPSAYVKEVIDYVKTYLRIDERRIYITGLSLGGGGTWVAAQDFPELFAAVAPVCGGYNSPSKACGLASENLPVWAFHGDADGVVSMSKTVNMVNAINACTPVPSPLAKLTIYPNVGHSAWNNAYKIDNTVHTPNLYQWIQSYTNVFNKGNRIPIANAGVDKIVNLPNSVSIAGAGTDTDGSIASYSWTQLAGPSTAVLTNSLSSTVTASNLVLGNYIFRLTVKDNIGNSDSDYISIKVQQPPPNVNPVSNAGADKNIVLPTNAIILSGSGTDADGTITAFAWSKISGSTATMSGTTTSRLSLSNLIAGSYVFRLTVTDDRGAKTSDDVTVTVDVATTSTGGNVAPFANAGNDKTIQLPTSSTVLSGSATDTDGVIRYFKWSKISGASVYTYGVSTPNLQISNLKLGTYVFRLTVTDDKGAVGIDDVQLVVKDGVTSATSITTDAVAVNIVGSETSGGSVVLGDKTLTDLENATVVVYNKDGNRVFDGEWKINSYEDVFRQGGLFVYTIVKEGKKVDMGKIYVVH